MGSVITKTGSIFNTTHQTIVNTVNCVGVMGAGLALECRYRYPEMFLKYKKLCDNKMFDVGKLFLYKSENRWILNFPTKYHWKYESKLEYLEKGFEKLITSYQSKKIESIAFPLLGAQNGGINKQESLFITKKYAEKLDIPVEIYDYDPYIADDLFTYFKESFIEKSHPELVKSVGIKKTKVEIIKSLLLSGDIKNMIQLSEVKGVGESTIQKCFDFAKNSGPEENTQLTLF